MCRMHRIFFNAALQPLKSQSLETNLTEAIFRHFQHATKKTGEHKVFLKIDVWLCLVFQMHLQGKKWTSKRDSEQHCLPFEWIVKPLYQVNDNQSSKYTSNPVTHRLRYDPSPSCVHQSLKRQVSPLHPNYSASMKRSFCSSKVLTDLHSSYLKMRTLLESNPQNIFSPFLQQCTIILEYFIAYYLVLQVFCK